MSGLINNSDLGLFEKLDEQLSKTATKVDSLVRSFEELRNLLDGDLKTKLVSLRSEVKGVAVDAENSAKKLGGLEDLLQKMAKTNGTYQASVQKSEKAIKGYEKEIEKLRLELEKLKKAKEAGTKTTAQYSKGISALTARFSAAYIGVNLIENALRGMGRQLKEAFNSTIDFEREMQATNAVTRATSAELVSLTANANKLGASTEYTAVEIAKLQKELGKLGFTASEIVSATDAITDLATATQEDLVQAGQVAASTIRIFGLEATETARVVDVMTGSFVRSALDLSKYRESMKLLGPIAQAANIDLETTTAILSRLADAGLSGSLAGTSLRNILSRMSDPTSKISKMLGYTVENSEQLIDAFKRMNATGIGLTETIHLMDVRARPAFLTFLQQVDNIDNLADEFKNLTGEGERLAEMMRDTLANDLDILDSAFDALRRGGLEGFNEELRRGTQLLTNFTEGLRLVIAEKIPLSNFLAEATRAFYGFFAGSQEAINEFNHTIRDAQVSEEYDQLKSTLDGVSENFELANDENAKFVRTVSEAKEELNRLKKASEEQPADKTIAGQLAGQLKLVNSLSDQVTERFGEGFTLPTVDGNWDPQIASLEAFIRKQEESFLLGVESTRQQSAGLARLNTKLEDRFQKQAEITKSLREEQQAYIEGYTEQLAAGKRNNEIGEEREKLLQKVLKSEAIENEIRSEQNSIIAQQALIQSKLSDFVQKEAQIKEKNAQNEVDSTVEVIEARADYLKIREQELKFEVEEMSKLAAKDKRSYSERLSLVQDIAEKKKELAKASLDYELQEIETSAKNASDRLTRRIMAQNMYEKEIRASEQELTLFIQNEMQKRFEQEEKLMDRRIDLNARAIRTQIKNLAETNEAIKAAASIATENEIAQAERDQDRLAELQYKKRKDAIKRLDSLRKEAAKRQLEEQLASAQAGLEQEKRTLISSQDFKAQSRATQEEMLSQLEDKYDQYNKNIRAQFEDTNADIVDNTITEMQRLGQTLAKIASEVFTAMGTIAQGFFENRAQQIQDDLDKVNEWEEERTNLAGDNEEARIAIEREADRRRRQLEHEKAKREKEQALFNIGLSIAQGIATSFATLLPPANFINAGIVAAQGAIALTMAASKKIPAFAEGTESSPEGPALVSDGGGRELAVERSGKTFLTPMNPSIVNLKGGTKIYDAEETQSILKALRGGDINNLILDDFYTRIENSRLDVEKILTGFTKEIKSIPRDQIFMDESGYSRYQERNGRRTKSLNKRYGFKY